ncbi:hypothetical protein AB3Y40_06720 [Yoonia sp. R2331]|uniref:hypothetical protein n=1 Tax=Yoonia sp. R2331 TaxID=3237238 RepID=UPI0034E51AF4
MDDAYDEPKYRPKERKRLDEEAALRNSLAQAMRDEMSALAAAAEEENIGLDARICKLMAWSLDRILRQWQTGQQFEFSDKSFRKKRTPDE